MEATITKKMDIATAKRLMVQNAALAAEAEKELAALREEVSQQVEALWNAFNERNADTIQFLEEAKERADGYESFLRESAIEHYQTTGEKTLDDNLGVRVNTKLEYEMPLAVAWCDQNAPVLVQKVIDRKVFEKFPGVDALPFVTKQETVTAVLKGF